MHPAFERAFANEVIAGTSSISAVWPLVLMKAEQVNLASGKPLTMEKKHRKMVV